MVVNTGTRLFDMLNDEVMTDVTFVVQGTEIKGHRVVASSQGGVLRELLENCKDNRVEISQDIAPHTFKTVLQCIYTGCGEVNDMNLFELTHAAKNFELHELQQMCADATKCKLSPTNVGVFTSQVLQFDAKESLRVCLDFFQSNMLDVIKSQEFLDISVKVLLTFCSRDRFAWFELELFLACVDWAGKECVRQNSEATPENLRAVLGDVLSLIRFSCMSKQDFEDFVVPLDILTAEEVGQVIITTKKKDKEFWGLSGNDWKKAVKMKLGRDSGGSCSPSDVPPAEAENILEGHETAQPLFAASTLTGSFSSSGSSVSIAETFPSEEKREIFGTVIEFDPLPGTDTDGRSPVHYDTLHQCITVMEEYQDKSLEELRLEDYILNSVKSLEVSTDPFGFLAYSSNSSSLHDGPVLHFGQQPTALVGHSLFDQSSASNFQEKKSAPNDANASATITSTSLADTGNTVSSSSSASQPAEMKLVFSEGPADTSPPVSSPSPEPVDAAAMYPGFNFSQPAANSSVFGQFAATGFAQSGFGQPAAPSFSFGQPSATGFSFGQPAATGFGQSATTGFNFGSPKPAESGKD